MANHDEGFIETGTELTLISIRVNKYDWDEFYKHCRSKGRSRSETIRLFINSLINEKEKENNDL